MSFKHHRKIHAIIKKHHPDAVHKAKKIFSFKYLKILILIGIVAFTYFLLSRPFVHNWIDSLGNLGYLGIWFAGICNTFGSVAPIGMGLLLTIEPEILILAALIGGIGAMMGDLLIFSLVKGSFKKELKEMEKSKTLQKIKKLVKKNKKVIFHHYLFYIFAGILIASPLPDEFGVSMLAGLTTIKPLKLGIISFLSHGTVIFFILAL